jgi:hypothetical protein
MGVTLQELLIVFVKDSWRKFNIVPPGNSMSARKFIKLLILEQNETFTTTKYVLKDMTDNK